MHTRNSNSIFADRSIPGRNLHRLYDVTLNSIHNAPILFFLCGTSDLQRDLYALEQRPGASTFMRRRPLCYTLAGNCCDLLSVTSLTEVYLCTRAGRFSTTFTSAAPCIESHICSETVRTYSSTHMLIHYIWEQVRSHHTNSYCAGNGIGPVQASGSACSRNLFAGTPWRVQCVIHDEGCHGLLVQQRSKGAETSGQLCFQARAHAQS